MAIKQDNAYIGFQKYNIRAMKCQLLYGSTQCYLPVTRHMWTRSTLTSARQAGTRLTYPGVMKG